MEAKLEADPEAELIVFRSLALLLLNQTWTRASDSFALDKISF